MVVYAYLAAASAHFLARSVFLRVPFVPQWRFSARENSDVPGLYDR